MRIIYVCMMALAYRKSNAVAGRALVADAGIFIDSTASCRGVCKQRHHTNDTAIMTLLPDIQYLKTHGNLTCSRTKHVDLARFSYRISAGRAAYIAKIAMCLRLVGRSLCVAVCLLSPKTAVMRGADGDAVTPIKYNL